MRLLRLSIGLIGVGVVAGCTSWEQTRENVVNPIHSLLHHDYADAIESTDIDEVRRLFAAEGDLAPSRELLGLFASVEQARVAIERVDRSVTPPTAELEIAVEGIGPDGERRSVRQTKIVTLTHQPPASWRMLEDRAEPALVLPRPATYFADETTARGLWFRHESAKVPDPNGEPRRFIYGSGVAVFDADGDDWSDVLLIAGNTIELFLNRRGSFVQVSSSWGFGQAYDRVLTAVLPFDFDNDGRRDLFVAAEQGPPLLFRNLGQRFAPVDAGIATSERTIGAVAADFDGDGWLDLFLANHENVFWEAPDPPGSARNARPDQLFLNNRDGTFRDFTEQAGVGNRGWSLSPVAADYDLDGDVDLFVGNDFGLDVLYRNDGNARFEEVSAASGVDKPVASMSADWGDFDGDGDFDLFIAGMRSGSGWVLEVPEFRVDRVPRIVDVLFRPYVREVVRSWFRGNRLYENQGDGTFVEISADSGAADSNWGWGTVWLDFDNDGRLDIYGANGFISGPSEADI